MNAATLRPFYPIVGIIAGFLVIYFVWVASLFRRRKDGTRRRWRRQDWYWVPLAAVTGALLLGLWWHLRQGP